MDVYVRGIIWYTCTLNDEDARKVIAYAKENDCDYEEAVGKLYSQGEIELYDNCIESDYSTEQIENVDIEDIELQQVIEDEEDIEDEEGEY